MLILGRYEAKVCDCGFHESLTNDKVNHFGFEVRTCLVCRGAAKYARIQDEVDEQERKALKDNPRAYRSSDGRRVFTKLLSGDEVTEMQTTMQARRAASGTAPAADAAPRPARSGSARRRALAGHRS